MINLNITAKTVIIHMTQYTNQPDTWRYEPTFEEDEEPDLDPSRYTDQSFNTDDTDGLFTGVELKEF